MKQYVISQFCGFGQAAKPGVMQMKAFRDETAGAAEPAMAQLTIAPIPTQILHQTARPTLR